jgi:hypothetical protein
MSPGHDKNRGTRIIGKPKHEYDKEAVLVIWEYKDTVHCGHAAMKLKKRDKDFKMQRLDYVSWWPAGFRTEKSEKLANKVQTGKLPPFIGNFLPRTGLNSPAYSMDEVSELGEDKKIAIFLSYFYRAFEGEKDDKDKERLETNLKKILKEIWDEKKEWQKSWKELGFQDEFRNMGEMVKGNKIGILQRQKVEKSPDSRYRGQGPRDVNLVNIKRDINTWDMGKTKEKEGFGKRRFVSQLDHLAKLPDVKIYVPCAHLKRTLKLKNDRLVQFRFVWGLSFDAIRVSWTIFKAEPNPHWDMVTTETNCASAVWNRLMDGHADALLEGKTGDLVKTITRQIYIQPNDIMSLGDSLELALVKLNGQQQIIDVAMQNHYQAVRALAVNRTALGKTDKNNWLPLLESSAWHDVSKTQNVRPQLLRAIDAEVKAFENAGKGMQRAEEGRIIKAIMQDEKLHLDLRKQLAKAKKAKMPDSQIKALEEKSEATRKKMAANFKTITKHRHEKAKHLVKLHNAIFKYVESAQNGDERLPSVLLLAQCVACAFYEATHYNTAITLRPLQHSFVPEVSEEEVDNTEAVIAPLQIIN